jgi:hypothetical protein
MLEVESNVSCMRHSTLGHAEMHLLDVCSKNLTYTDLGCDEKCQGKQCSVCLKGRQRVRDWMEFDRKVMFQMMLCNVTLPLCALRLGGWAQVNDQGFRG